MAIVQEIVMRGEVFRLVERVAGSWIALVLSTGGLAVVQLSNPSSTSLSALAAILANGILFTAAFIGTRRLWAGIGLHVGLVGPALIMKMDLTSANDWTSNGLGMAQTWPAITISVIAGTALLWRASLHARVVAPAWTRGKPDARRQKRVVEFG